MPRALHWRHTVTWTLMVEAGWLVDYMHSSNATSAAADFHGRITQNSAMSSPVLPDETSSAIFTSNVDLTAYSEIVYGWAPSGEEDVNRYGHYTSSGDIDGACYVDGYCGANVSIGTVEFSLQATLVQSTPEQPRLSPCWIGIFGSDYFVGIRSQTVPPTVIGEIGMMETPVAMRGTQVIRP